MRVGVIRGDVPSPIFLADLEPTSQTNFPTEPVGQTRYVSRPDPTALTNYMAGLYASDTQDGAPAVTLPLQPGQPGYGGVPAGVQSTAAVTFPVVITGGNNTLQFKNLLANGFTTVTVASGSYATMAAILTALNAVMAPTGFGSAVADASGTKVVIESSVPGVGSYISVGAGGTINATLNLPTAAFTMPAATAIITALNPVVIPPATGSINVSPANILTTLGASPAAAGVANLIAPQFFETEVAVQSFQVGNLAKYLELSWNPDARRLPAIASGPAIEVVANDGTTPFTAPLPMITTAVHNVPNAGDITITGVGLGNSEYASPIQAGGYAGTVVIVRAAGNSTTGTGTPQLRLTQRQISNTFTGGTQGVVTATSIVIPASLLTYSPGGSPFPPSTNPGSPLGVAGSTVEVKYETFANTNYGAAATVSAFAPATGLVTLTGLTTQQASQVGSYITLSGCASAGNNGTFQIVAWISATSVQIYNIYGVAPDANNGAIVWSEPPPVAFVVT